MDKKDFTEGLDMKQWATAQQADTVTPSLAQAQPAAPSDFSIPVSAPVLEYGLIGAVAFLALRWIMESTTKRTEELTKTTQDLIATMKSEVTRTGDRADSAIRELVEQQRLNAQALIEIQSKASEALVTNSTTLQNQEASLERTLAALIELNKLIKEALQRGEDIQEQVLAQTGLVLKEIAETRAQFKGFIEVELVQLIGLLDQAGGAAPQKLLGAWRRPFTRPR